MFASMALFLILAQQMFAWIIMQTKKNASLLRIVLRALLHKAHFMHRICQHRTDVSWNVIDLFIQWR